MIKITEFIISPTPPSTSSIASSVLTLPLIKLEMKKAIVKATYIKQKRILILGK